MSNYIHFHCPTCDAAMSARIHRASDKINCLKCGQRLQIPSAEHAKTILATRGAEPSAPMTAVDPANADQWSFARGKEKFGPFTFAQLGVLALKGHLRPTDMLHKEGSPKWIPASSVQGLFGPPPIRVAPAPPPLPFRAVPQSASLLAEGWPTPPSRASSLPAPPMEAAHDAPPTGSQQPILLPLATEAAWSVQEAPPRYADHPFDYTSNSQGSRAYSAHRGGAYAPVQAASGANSGCSLLLTIWWHFPCLGFLNAIHAFLLGLLLTVTVIAAPIGLGLMEFGKFLFSPFRHAMVSKSDLNVEQNPAWKAYSTIIMLFYLPFGLILAIVGVFQVVALCLTIVGIPVAIVVAKSLGTYLNPVNKKCVHIAVADELARRRAVAEIDRHLQY